MRKSQLRESRSAGVSSRNASPEHGCYNSDRRPISVQNDTDSPALVFDDRDCRGKVTEIVDPWEHGVSAFGQSVRIN